ncbi:hypothetical protein F4861DRAFT_540870 [Xylaria intraflava]|nr:hypothetical protein F4861DRAFT_540870 [Xylaria intraflava]
MPPKKAEQGQEADSQARGSQETGSSARSPQRNEQSDSEKDEAENTNGSTQHDAEGDSEANSEDDTSTSYSSEEEDEEAADHPNLEDLWYIPGIDMSIVQPTRDEVESGEIDAESQRDGLSKMQTGPQCPVCGHRFSARSILTGLTCLVCGNWNHRTGDTAPQIQLSFSVNYISMRALWCYDILWVKLETNLSTV